MEIVAHACACTQQGMAEVFRVEESRVLHNLGKDLIGVLVGIAGNDVQRLEFGPGVEPECRLLP